MKTEAIAAYFAIIFIIVAAILVIAGLATTDTNAATPATPVPTQGIVRLYAEPVVQMSFEQPAQEAPVSNPVNIEPVTYPGEDPAGAVMPVITFPSRWYVCTDQAKVYGGLQERQDWYLYSLSRDAEVLVRELGSDTSWAMIQPAHWTKFINLCQAED